jgi:beta-galactosidase/beta-glucuronidase
VSRPASVLLLLVAGAVLLAAPVTTTLAAVAAAAEDGRQSLLLDEHWRFLRADAAGAERGDFDDDAWSAVILPHTFNAQDGDIGGGYYRGIAWYRRTLQLPRLDAKHRYYLQFDGAALATDVWINGRHAGRHEGGYAAFRFDVSALLRRGANLIAVRVDNSHLSTVAPLGGDFTVFGGLYRSVHLLITDRLHIDPLDFAGPGVYVSADELTADEATVRIVTRVRNAAAETLHARVIVSLFDAQGSQIELGRRTVSIPAGAVLPVVQTAALHRPHRWDGIADPYLYRVTATLVEFTGGSARITDSVSVPLGLRSIAIDANRGLLLNGRPYALHGVNLFHAGRPGKGLAVDDEEIDADWNIMREMGVTGLRLAHFQHPQRIYDDADRSGLLVWTEVPLNGAVDPSPAFLDNLEQQLRELIRQNYNHPSVIVWGLGNEVHASDADGRSVLADLQRVARAEDPSRPTTYAHCCTSDTDVMAAQTDVIAYNRYFGWYLGQLQDLGPWADRLHAEVPTRPFAVSEYGAGGSIYQQEDPPARPHPSSHWHPEQYQALYHESSWRSLHERPYLWAAFVWVGFDLASSGRNEGDRAGINDKGLVTYDRLTRKDAYYWYQANWTSTPMLHITSPRATPRHMATVDIKVYTNTNEISLKVNGHVLDPGIAVDHVVSWTHVPLEPGMNDIVAESDVKGITDAVHWDYVPDHVH